jgi:hypothetical protein
MPMKSQLAQNTTKSAKNLAQQIAKQMAGELPEVLKTAGGQITGAEVAKPQEAFSESQSGDQNKLIAHQQELQDKMQAGRRMEALERELEDIRKQDLFSDLQRKVSEGEVIPLVDYHELSMEQKQVLKAQMEAVKFQKDQAEFAQAEGRGSLFGSAKKGRKMGGGQKQEAEKQQTRVEKPVPPSG